MLLQHNQLQRWPDAEPWLVQNPRWLQVARFWGHVPGWETWDDSRARLKREQALTMPQVMQLLEKRAQGSFVFMWNRPMSRNFFGKKDKTLDVHYANYRRGETEDEILSFAFSRDW